MYRDVAASPTLVMNEMAGLRARRGEAVYRLGFGQSPFPPPAPLTRILAARAGAHGYPPVAGLAGLRAAVARHYAHRHGVTLAPERVLVSAGSKMLIFAALAAHERLDVLIPAPAWVSYAPQARLLGHSAWRVATEREGRWRVTPAALEAVLAEARAAREGVPAPALLILTHPGNPDGLGYGAQALAALAETARRHDLLILSDEIYGELVFAGPPVSLAAIAPDLALVTSGLSKWAGAGGWRLGTAVLPEGARGAALGRAMEGVLSETVSAAPAPVQEAAIAAYDPDSPAAPEIAADLARRRALLAALGGWCAARLAAAGLAVPAPEGGFYLFVDFSPRAETLAARGIRDSQSLCDRLLAETGVALLAGCHFGMPDGHLSARLAFVDFDGAAALAALAEAGMETPPTDRDGLARLAPRVVAGIEALAGWVA